MKSETKRIGCWSIWGIIVLAVVGIHAVTLRISPTVWQDEVQIIDSARTKMAVPDSDWSINWVVDGPSKGGLSYLARTLQEIGYETTGGDLAGPRTTALLGAVFASAVMLGWLRARRIDWRVALACALLFLLDPVFAQSYRGARVDGWTMGFMLLGLWAVRGMLRREVVERPPWQPRAGHAVAALCVALAGLSWVSAILLIPLLIHELCCERDDDSMPNQTASPMRRCWDLVWVAVLSILAFGLLQFPFWLEIRQSISNVADGISVASDGRRNSSDAHGGTAYFVTFCKAFVETFKYNPWPLVVAGLCCLSRKRWPLALALGTAFIGVYLTRFYIHRAVYLLPYLVLVIALTGHKFVQAECSRVLRRLSLIAMTAMLVWASCVTLGARTVVAWKQRDARNYQYMRNLATSAIGPGAYRVYLDSWECYYAGRKLGWKLFRFYRVIPPGDNAWNELLKTMDFAIISTKDITEQKDKALKSLGFSRTRFDCGELKPEETPKMRNVASGYGSYWVYRKVRVSG